jgi:hypothetical protein
MAQNNFGAWQGTTIAPQYANGPTAAQLEPFSQVGGVINPGTPLTPPPSLTGYLEAMKIMPPVKEKKKKGRDRLTEAVMSLPPPDANTNYLNYTNYTLPGFG